MHLILHTLIDTLKIVPFLYLAFLIIEFIEHRLNNKNKKILNKSKRFAPLLGGILGMIPQCGFSVLATNLYATRIITIGTLISVFLSTSDEMLMILLGGGISFIRVLGIISLKALIGIIFGFLIDLIIRDKNKSNINEICNEENCHCHNNLFLASFKHTLSITLYILIATLLINLLMHHLETETISKIFFQGNIFSYFLSSLIGLIPNCASSVMISELYINEIISFGNMMSGLLTGSGVGILVLFKTNKNIKQNILILFLIFIIGVFSGIIIDLIGNLL